MGRKKKKKGNTTKGDKTIALNKRARFEYHIDERIEAGLGLEGWEVKCLRAGRVQLKESYVRILHGEAFLLEGRHCSLDEVESPDVDERIATPLREGVAERLRRCSVAAERRQLRPQ